MKALQSVGIIRAIRFVWFSFYGWLLHMSLPPVRVWLMRLAGARVGKDTVIFDVSFANLYHYGFSRLTIGDMCFLGDEVMLDVRGGITLGNQVTLSNRTTIVTHINVGFDDHPLQRVYPTTEAPVVIGDGAYTGTGAIILPGVTIGEQSVIGAGAVVTKDVPHHTLAVGVPAKGVKTYKY